MALFSSSQEMRCVATLLHQKIPESVRSSLLGKLDDTYFHYPPAKAVYERLNTVARKRFEMMNLQDLIEDPAVEEDFRDLVRESEAKPCTSKELIGRLVNSLDEYRKARFVYHASKEALEQLKSDSFNIEEVMDGLSDGLQHARKNIKEDQEIIRIGGKTNVREALDEALHDTKSDLIKCGFTVYDERNGGLPEEGVMILAATTSGGKSTLLMQLCKNLYDLSTAKAPRTICRVSLEMGRKQEMKRLLSNMTGIPFWKFKQNKLTKRERQAAEKAMTNFYKHGKKTGSQYDYVCPTRGMRSEEIFQMLKPYGYDVIGIDYISLLEGVDSENQWRMLSEVARQAKVYSRENNTLVIILAQLDSETSNLRYSKGIKEHADVMWSWNYTKPEVREMKELPIKCDKARDGEIFDFGLGEKFEVMQVVNAEGGSDYSADSVSSLADDDEDDEPDTGRKGKPGDDYALA